MHSYHYILLINKHYRYRNSQIIFLFSETITLHFNLIITMFPKTRCFIITLLLSQTFTREFSTNLYQFDKRIRSFTPHLNHVHTNQFQKVTIPFQPLNTLICDTQNFQKQTKNHWQKYTTLITDHTQGKRTQFSPDHHSHYFQKITWSPEEWTTITHQPTAQQYHFEMIYLQLIKKSLYIIYNEYGYTDPHNLHYFNSSDTIAFISRIIAYFYEHFTSVKFKLFTNISKQVGEFRGQCYVSAKKFPLIKQVLLTSETTQQEINTPYNEDRLIRLYTLSNVTYFATFPKIKISNEVPQIRNIQQYHQQIGHDYALDFQWSIPTDQGFSLHIKLGKELTYMPRIWWIQEQSDSILGFHKNFFLPKYLQTIQTTYSYARNMRHYYAEGFYVKKPGVKYFRQNLTEHTPVVTSWPIPTQQINIKHPPHVYFKPHLGNLETIMPRVLQVVERSPHIAQISKCQNYVTNFHTIQQERSTYHQKMFNQSKYHQKRSDQNKPLLSNLYSYKQTSHAKSDKRTNNVAQANLQRRIDNKAQLFRLLWNNVHPHVLNLEHNLLKYQFESSEETRLDIEKRIHHKIWTDYATWQAHSKAQHAYAQLLYETNYLSTIIPNIHKNFREMYAMTIQHKTIRLLRDSRHLKPYVLYQHIINSDSIESYPLKYDATRSRSLRWPTPFLVSSTKATTQTSSSTPTLTVLQDSSTRAKQTTSPVTEAYQTEKTNKHAEYNQNQTYNSVPWPWPNTPHSRPNLPTLQFIISTIKSQFHNLLHRLNNKYIATKQFLANLLSKNIKCDT